jgi:hypothetical protein
MKPEGSIPNSQSLSISNWLADSDHGVCFLFCLDCYLDSKQTPSYLLSVNVLITEVTAGLCPEPSVAILRTGPLFRSERGIIVKSSHSLCSISGMREREISAMRFCVFSKQKAKGRQREAPRK